MEVITISKKPYRVDDEVAELLILLSKERDQAIAALTPKEAGGQEVTCTEGLASHDLTIEDIWFHRNLEGLLGGEIALIKRGKKDKIDRQMLAEWIMNHF